MSALALSVLLSFVSAVAYAGGAIVQEQVALSSPGGSYLPLRRAGWWAALGLNGLGGVLHVVALAYGPLSLVQPLGALTIVFALPMAALCVGRRAGATAWRGAVMASVGLAGLLSVVGSAGTHSLDPAQRVAVALVTGGAVAALTVAGLAAHRHPAVRSVLLATASGIAFGMSSVFTKTVAVDWDAGIGLGDLPSLAVIGVFATAGVLLSQASYRGGGLAAPLATLTVVNPVLAAAVGILMFGETFRYGTTGTLLALGCGVVACGGLILLTTERLEPEREPVPGQEAVPASAPSFEQEAVPALAPAAEDEAPVPGFAAREALTAVPRQRGSAAESGRDSAGRVEIGDPDPDELAELAEIAGIAWATEVVRMTEMAEFAGDPAPEGGGPEFAGSPGFEGSATYAGGPGFAGALNLAEGPASGEEPKAGGGPGTRGEPDVAGSPEPPGEPATPDTTDDTVPASDAAAPAFVLPPSYAPLSATFYVPLPVLHRQRQRYARVRS
ncbi:DMT family transporter [Streptomyces sp. WI03-4A]|uniref:DMT family transporter n=1 Tax=Streptomyces TaxID=1883 RepID=UPI0029B8A3BC|nr:DMT family transporter [Streptomyces sp. WI03-4A]MDX2594442.1 DMT family transporter [Streptomyces sp. WI03-4A]